MPIVSIAAICTAMVLSYFSSKASGDLWALHSFVKLDPNFLIPFISWTVDLLPLAVAELVWRRFSSGKLEFQPRGYLVMVVYFVVGRLFSLAVTKLEGGHHMPVLINLHMHGMAGYIASAILTLLTVDFIYYWIHRAQHTFGFLWQFHSQHHAIQDVNSYNCYHHVTEHIVDMVVATFVSMFVFGFDTSPPFLAVYFGLIGQYNHARIDFFDYGKARAFLGDPKFHLSHHLNVEKYIGKNFGGFTAIYDMIFRTYVEPDASAFKGPYGVDGMPNPTIRSIFKFW